MIIVCALLYTSISQIQINENRMQLVCDHILAVFTECFMNTRRHSCCSAQEHNFYTVCVCDCACESLCSYFLTLAS